MSTKSAQPASQNTKPPDDGERDRFNSYLMAFSSLSLIFFAGWVYTFVRTFDKDNTAWAVISAISLTAILVSLLVPVWYAQNTTSIPWESKTPISVDAKRNAVTWTFAFYLFALTFLVFYSDGIKNSPLSSMMLMTASLRTCTRSHFTPASACEP